MTQRRFRAPSPALVISLIALFVALGGTTAYASGLISGEQIVNHSIPARKLTVGAVYALRGQPGTRSFFLSPVPPDSVVHRLTTTHGIDVSYKCDRDTQQIHFFLTSHEGDHSVWVSGDYAPDGVLKSIGRSPTRDQFNGHGTLNLDVIASTPALDGRFSRIDLGGVHGGYGCTIGGLITPSTGLQQPLG